MNEPSHSPKRRHILSSINPDDHSSHRKSRRRRSRSRSRSPASRHHGDGESSLHRADKEGKDDQDGDPNAPRRSRLKLKDHKSSRRRRRHSRSRSRSRSRDGRHHRHRHRHRRHRSPSPANPHDPEPLDREAAFRESLFDAMADDEGALYWEGVYGQPVHVYPNERVGPQGELERMSDEEYAAHVRQKMWEKTHAGLLEERARRDEARRTKQRDEAHQRRLQEQMDESLRRGQERRARRRWAQRWREYNEAWAGWDEAPAAAASLPWPCESGQRRDLDEKAVRAFYVGCLRDEEGGEKGFLARLKDERVRWHPDKIQQKLGGQVDEDIMRDVTSIFQIIDRLWADIRDGK